MVAVSLYYRGISISIVVTVLLYDNRPISISIMVVVPVTVAWTHSYTNGSNTDPDLFCYGRHCANKYSRRQQLSLQDELSFSAPILMKLYEGNPAR